MECCCNTRGWRHRYPPTHGPHPRFQHNWRSQQEQCYHHGYNKGNRRFQPGRWQHHHKAPHHEYPPNYEYRPVQSNLARCSHRNCCSYRAPNYNYNCKGGGSIPKAMKQKSYALKTSVDVGKFNSKEWHTEEIKKFIEYRDSLLCEEDKKVFNDLLHSFIRNSKSVYFSRKNKEDLIVVQAYERVKTSYLHQIKKFISNNKKNLHEKMDDEDLITL